MERKELIKKELQYGRSMFLQIGFVAAFLVAYMAFIPIKAQGTAQSVTTHGGDTTIYLVGNVEEDPEFSGGKIGRIMFFSENIKYPKEAREEKLQGSVVVEFIVETDGSLTNFEVVEGVHPILDEEALRVFKLMPKWEPGKHQGKTVRVKNNLTITFTEEWEDGKKYREELNKNK